MLVRTPSLRYEWDPKSPLKGDVSVPYIQLTLEAVAYFHKWESQAFTFLSVDCAAHSHMVDL